jgi:hypothetical protein
MRKLSAVGADGKLQLRTENGDGEVLSVDLDHLVSLAAGETDLGDVVVHQPTIVLSGTVKDQLGAPIYWACVDIARKEFHEERPDRWLWLSVGGLRAMTDEQGSFVCTGSLEPGEYGYCVRSEGHVDTKVIPFLPGTEGLEIELAQYGRLEGSLRLRDGVSTESIVIDARGEAQPWEPRNWLNQRHHPLPTGKFLLEQAPPGKIDVRFRLDAESEPILSVLGVMIEPGRTTRDPRLQEIDLRASLYAYELDLFGVAGEIVSQAQVAFWPTGNATAVPRRLLTLDGNLTLTSPWPVIDLEVMARGFRTTKAAGMREDRRIALEVGVPVRVQLAEDVDLPDPPICWRRPAPAGSIVPASGHVYSESDGHRIQMIGGRTGRVLAERELLCTLPGSANTWSIGRSSSAPPAQASGGSISRSGPSTIRVEEGSGSRFVLAPRSRAARCTRQVGRDRQPVPAAHNLACAGRTGSTSW